MKAKPLTTTFWHNWPPHEIVIRHEVMFTFNPEQWRDVIGCMQKQCRTGSDSGQELSTGLDPLSSAEAAKAFLRNVVDGILNTPSLKIWTRTGAVDYILNVKRGTMPSAASSITRNVLPALMNGRGSPVIGIRPIDIAMLMYT